MFPFDLPENIKPSFSDVFRGIKREHWEVKGLHNLLRRSFIQS